MNTRSSSSMTTTPNAFPTRRHSSAAPHRHWNITDDMIGATVPRKARSGPPPSVKRPHESAAEEQSLQSAEAAAAAASPSSSDVSLRKKMKSIEPKTQIPKAATEDDIDEIEIAELLFGLRSSTNHNSSSSQKLGANDSPEKQKMEDYSVVTNNSAAESVRIDNEQPEKMEKHSPGSTTISGCHEVSGKVTGSSEFPNADNEKDNKDSGDTLNGRSEIFAGESTLCSKSKMDVDKLDSASTREVSSVSGSNNQGVDKFEIDLMAPPPVSLSSERDNSSRRVKKEETQEEVKINFDLEEQYRNKEEILTLTNPKMEKTVQSRSLPLSIAVSEWPNSLSLFGYVPPMETVVKTEKTTGSTTDRQRVNFVLSQPRTKRCATHHCIASNIFTHQQCAKMNPLLPLAIGYGSSCESEPNNVNRMHSAENTVVGKQSQKHSPDMNQNAAQGKGRSATSDFSLAAIKSSGPANPMDLIQMKQLVLQQGPHPGSLGSPLNGPAFLFPPGQHQASVTTTTSQASGANSTSSASSSSKSHSSAAGSFSTSTLPAVPSPMSFSYPNLAVNDAPYMTTVQNNGYPFPFLTPLGASATIRSAGPAQATHMLNGPMYSSQLFHPLQHPQQHPRSQAMVQPSYLNASSSTVLSSSHKQSQGIQVSNNVLPSTSMQLQQSRKDHTSSSRPCKLETGMAGENGVSLASGKSYSQKNVFGQKFTIPVQPLNLSFRPSAASDSVAGNSGNFGDKQQLSQATKGGADKIPSQAFAISFSGFDGTSVPSNLNFSTRAQSPVIFQSMPDVAWPGYQATSTSHSTQQKIYSITEGESGGNSSHQDDEKKATSRKPSTNGPTTLVFDNSSKNLNFVSSSMNGIWPSCSITSSATTTSMPLSSNASNYQQPPQLLHLHQQHDVLQQQPAMANLYIASSTTANATTATRFFNSPPVFSQTETQCTSYNQASQSKNSGRTLDSQVMPIITSTTPTFKNFSQEQGRVIQGHKQISFGGNYTSSLPPQGQQLLNKNQPSGTSSTISVALPHVGNLKTNSQGSKVGSTMNNSQMQQTENSSVGTGQKSSPVCGRNVPSILSSCPSHLSELKY